MVDDRLLDYRHEKAHVVKGYILRSMRRHLYFLETGNNTRDPQHPVLFSLSPPRSNIQIKTQTSKHAGLALLPISTLPSLHLMQATKVSRERFGYPLSFLCHFKLLASKTTIRLSDLSPEIRARLCTRKSLFDGHGGRVTPAVVLLVGFL